MTDKEKAAVLLAAMGDDDALEVIATTLSEMDMTAERAVWLVQNLDQKAAAELLVAFDEAR